MERKNFMGLDGFVWFIGVVENRKDPLNLNRCQIRAFGWHTDNKALIPTAELPWAQPLLPYNGSSTSAGPKEGDMVIGFFTDGNSAQFPVVFGVLPGIPDTLPPIDKGFSDPRSSDQLSKAPKKPASRTYSTNGSGGTITEGTAKRYPDVLNEPTTSRIARNESIDKTLIQERKNNVVNVPTATSNWTEPTTKYAPVFPYNKVTETESGHVFEVDDTPGAERISNTHRSGTFEEVHPDGSKVTKVVKDNYEVIMKDDNVYVMGKCNLTVQGDVQTYIKGNYSVKVAGNYNLDVYGITNERHEGKYNVYYGSDTLTRKQSGKTDFTCPSDVRNGADDCSNVPGL
jgi:hypothetical protein